MRKMSFWVLLWAGTAFCACPEIDKVQCRQIGGKFSITYTLSNGPGIVTASVFTNGAAVADEQLTGMTGDVNKRVETGADREILWRPSRTSTLTGLFKAGEVSVRLTAHRPSRPPRYMAVDLVSGAVSYYVSSNAVPGGVLNDVYKKTSMLFRRIDAANVLWRMGTCEKDSPRDFALCRPRPVTLTYDYYMAVFEMTHAQFRALAGYDSGSSDFKNCAEWDLMPVEYVSYQTMRGAIATYDFWTDRQSAATAGVLPGSPIGRLRARTGNGLPFDLPTAAEWEYAARAGSLNRYIGDVDVVRNQNVTELDAETRAALDAYAWFSFNSKTDETVDAEGVGRPHRVGGKRPNGWGLYDMGGNVNEIVHDYAIDKAATVISDGSYEVDPIGPPPSRAMSSGYGRHRQVKGGGYSDGYVVQRPEVVHDKLIGETGWNKWCGIRLACPIAQVFHAPMSDTPLSEPVFSFDPVSREAVISYTLAQGEPRIVTLDVKTNGCSIGTKHFVNLGGAVNRVVNPGNHRIFWRPDQTWPDHCLDTSKDAVTVEIRAWTTNNPPDYAVIDLAAANLPVFYYVDADAVPGGVTHALYKTSKLVMRKIPAANVVWRMGRPKGVSPDANGPAYDRYVQLTKDYWISVFQITERQYYLVTAGSTSNYKADPLHWTMPLHNISWGAYSDGTHSIRGADATWPSSHYVNPESFLGKLRVVQPAFQFDLPTEAQWEYAYRAGTDTLTPWGDTVAQNASDPFVWNRGNWHLDPALTEKKPHEVGLLTPNGWGLYDMGGNINEWCLDYYRYNPAASEAGAVTVNPVGPLAPDAGCSTHRVLRGGSWDDDYKRIASHVRTHLQTPQMCKWRGIRLVAPVVPEEIPERGE